MRIHNIKGIMYKNNQQCLLRILSYQQTCQSFRKKHQKTTLLNILIIVLLPGILRMPPGAGPPTL
jgi:hypothetical protein